MIFSSQGEFPSNMSRYYANKLNKLFEGDINNTEIDDTLREAKDNLEKILSLEQQISDINSTQKSSNSIKSQLEECKLCKFKLEKISSIRAFLIQAESKNFKDMQRESKLFNITQNITTLSDNLIKTLSDDFKEITPPQGSYSVINYDKIYSKLFKNYCDIYQTINQEKQERSEDNPYLRPPFLSPRTVYDNLDKFVPVSVPTTKNLPPHFTSSELTTNKQDLPSAQPQLRSGGIKSLIDFYTRLYKGLGDKKPLENFYNK